MPTVRFASFLAPNIHPVYQFIVDRIGAALNVRAELHTGAAFDEFARGEADAGFL